MTTLGECPLCHHAAHPDAMCGTTDMAVASMRCMCPGVAESIAAGATSGGDDVPTLGLVDTSALPRQMEALLEPVQSPSLWGYNLTGALMPRMSLDDSFMPGGMLGPGEHFGAVLIPLTVPCSAGCNKGIVTSPVWLAFQRYANEFAPQMPNHEQMREWWRQRGFDDINHLPDDTDDCIECLGKGEVLTPTGDRLIAFLRRWLS